MAGPRQPIALLMANGKKHLTKAEIADRMASEVKPLITGEVEAPPYLTKKQKAEFYKIFAQLSKLKIIGETDVDTLARYIVSQDLYINAVKNLRKTEVKADPYLFEKWSNIQDRYFKQCRSSANDLGLSISSRCKLVVPEINETPKENKFKRFEKAPE